MCARARLPTDYSELKIQIQFGEHRAAPNLRPSWNIAPTQDMLCAVRDPETGERKPVKMHWGLIPKWSKEAKLKYPTFNAKAETITERPTFRGAWKADRRCLVITDGFYEWRKSDKQPFAIARVKGKLTVMSEEDYRAWEAEAGLTSKRANDPADAQGRWRVARP